VLSAAHSAWAQAPKADRPTYAVGDKWIRSDGAYDLIRIENGRYVFAADGGREVHLTRDLGVAKIVRGGQVLLELEPPPGLTWPLEVGQSGVSWLTLKSLDPQFGQSVVRLTWKVDAYQDVRVPAGVFKPSASRRCSSRASRRFTAVAAARARVLVRAGHPAARAGRRQRSEAGSPPGRRPRPARGGGAGGRAHRPEGPGPRGHGADHPHR